MSETESPTRPITGGCQCGAVRYEAPGPLQKVHLCHCRMCQRAVGNVFAALAGVPKTKLKWTAGQPASFASSSLAKRGFCARCGTPLYFAYDQAARIYVTIGSLDDPASAVPEIQYGVESQLPWLHVNADLPREETQRNEKLAQMTVYQFGGASTHG
jgi:hypothetical protein